MLTNPARIQDLFYKVFLTEPDTNCEEFKQVLRLLQQYELRKAKEYANNLEQEFIRLEQK